MAVDRSMVFHHPLPIEDAPRVGSTAHVMRMIEGFAAAGFEVEIVAGYSSDRLRAMRRVRDQVAAGRTFEFVYAESSTAPTCLNDPRHLPTHPIADWRFFRSFRHRGVPVGLFYPDVHWRFPFYKSAVPRVKRLIAAAFYHYDLRWYHHGVDLLFLPSTQMRHSVPSWSRSGRVVGLAPGGVVDPLPHTPHAGNLNLFYVGSIRPPLYDIGDLLDAVPQVPGVFLTVCCPTAEAALAAEIASDRIQVVHEHGDALRERYGECDASCIVYAPEPYRDFTMPVKLFESIGFGRPVISSSDTSAATFVEQTRTGWVVDRSTIVATLADLVADPSLVRTGHAAVVAQQQAHSWESRARFVAASLLAPAHARPRSPTEP